MLFFTETGWHLWIYKEGKKDLTQSILDDFNEMKGPDYILPYLIAQHVMLFQEKLKENWHDDIQDFTLNN